jgi:hypothetical protein
MMLGPIIRASGIGGGRSRCPSGGSVPGGIDSEAGAVEGAFDGTVAGMFG